MRRTLAVLIVAGWCGGSFADDAETDGHLYEVLKVVHNQGADMYNAGDSMGCYRLFQGALQTASPLLEHHAGMREKIAEGLAAVESEPSIVKRAFRLHELIEEVRAEIKPGDGGAAVPMKEPVQDPDSGPMPEKITVKPKEVVPEPEKPKDPMPMPLEGNPDSPVAGKVTMKGEPAAGIGVFLVGGAPGFRIFSAKTGADGTLQLSGVPDGTYGVMLSGDAVPAQYTLISSSPLQVQVTGGKASIDIDIP